MPGTKGLILSNIHRVLFQIYHRLNRGDNKLVNRTISSRSFTENRQHESEIHPRINQQIQEDVDGEYESDSKEPNV